MSLDREECLAMLARHHTPEHVIRHCLKVGEVAERLGKALNQAGMHLDIQLIINAGLLHDIARGKEGDHAAEGERIVAPLNEAAARIIGGHMRHEYPASVEDITESDLVSLADRSVMEDVYAGFRPRMEEIRVRHKDNPEACRVLKTKIEETRQFVQGIEAKTGRSVDEIASAGAVPVLALLRQVERHGRYLGGEINMRKKDPTDVKTRFCFACPDLYEIGMSYTGLQILYSILNDQADVYCERTFAPAKDMETLLLQRDLPLFSLETHSALGVFDLLGFTLQYEHSYTNIIAMLALAGIPLLRSERPDQTPFLLAGGPCACNPEPLADVFDFFCIGDGETLLPRLCEAHGKWKKAGKSKMEFLEEIARWDGIYVPEFYRPIYVEGRFSGHEKINPAAPDRVTKQTEADLELCPYQEKPIVPLIETVHNREVVEIFRGCGRGCRFCQAGFVYRPVRRRSADRIFACVEEQLAATGYDEVSLLSLSTGDYPGIEQLVIRLMEDLKEKNVSLSLPSLRLDSVSEEALRRIGAYKKSSLTFAPEAGTQRLRDVIRKDITEEDIFCGVEKAIEIGWNRVKFYFMVGLPTETQADLDGMVCLAARVMERSKMLQPKGKRNFTLTVSVSNFVPKPHTPFQWAAGDSEEMLIEKNRYLKEKFHGVKGVTFKYHDTRSSFVEKMLAKGDRRMLKAILAAHDGGCSFDSWREHFNYKGWLAAFRTAGLSPEDVAFGDTEGPLPWDLIDVGVTKDYLKKEYAKALE